MLYGHGDDLYAYKDIKLNFSSNVYPYFNHEGLYKHLAEQMPIIAHYPEPTAQRLERTIAEHTGLQAEEVMVTSGATESIYIVAQAHSGRQSIIIAPTFSEYADACRMHSHTVEHIKALDEITDEAGLVWICNPNNPTGRVWPKEQLISTIERHTGTTFVIDASYAEFSAEAQPKADELVNYHNVLMLHSMTKRYAIPGLRLGYVTGNCELLDKTRNCRIPWTVNQMAQAAGHYLLEHGEEYQLPLEEVQKESLRVQKALNNIEGLEVTPSSTNFFLVKTGKGTATLLKKHLAENCGILIRDAQNFWGLDESYFRISVRKPEDNNELIERIKQWITDF